jgi:hypothetical protein
VLSFISETASNVFDKSDVNYVFDSLLAAASVYSGHENPRSAEWIWQLIIMSYQRNNWPPRLKLSTETLQKMVSEHELYMGLERTGLLEKWNKAEFRSGIINIVNTFGYEDEFLRIFFGTDL